MPVRHVALVSEIDAFNMRELTAVGAALQKQVVRDFGPIWRRSATVNAFANLEDVPIDYWPVIIVRDVQGAAGVHLDDQGQPYALVEVGEDWSMTASHETLEMLADPFGNRLVAGQSPKAGQGRVNFLVEVCDPSESGEHGYTVNGIRVSDFYTPSFFDPVASTGVRYSFTGALQEPRQVLKGGYLSWTDPISGHWFQKVFFGNAPEFRDLGPMSNAREGLRAGLRSMIDARTAQARPFIRLATEQRRVALRSQKEGTDGAGSARAKALRRQIAALPKKAPVD